MRGGRPLLPRQKTTAPPADLSSVKQLADPMKARAVPGWVFFAAGGAALLLTALVLAIGWLVAPPPTGPVVASLALTSGEPFKLTYPSDGSPQRVWLDMACEDCSLPVDGRVSISFDGSEQKSVEISAGSAEPLSDSAGLDSQPLTSIPSAPPGAVVAVSGVLSVAGPRGLLSSQPEPGKVPQVSRFRLSIAP